jgi:hypothetical protein
MDFDESEFQPIFNLFFKNKTVREFQDFAFSSYSNYVEQLLELVGDPQSMVLYLNNDNKNLQTSQIELQLENLEVSKIPQNNGRVLNPQFCIINGLSYTTDITFTSAKILHVVYNYKN